MSFRSFDLLNLVRDFGSEVILRKTSTAGVYDPSSGSVTGSATTDHTVNSYFFNFSVGLPMGDEVRRGSSRCIIPALGLTVEPDDEDKIIGLGSTYEVVSVSSIYSNTSVVCYICEVRD